MINLKILPRDLKGNFLDYKSYSGSDISTLVKDAVY